MSDQVSQGREGLRLTRPDRASAGHFDALAELFLGDEAARAATRTETREPAPRFASTEPHPAAAPAPRLVPAPAPQPQPEPAATDDADEGVILEVLMLGHLPVRATPWVGQYARRLAATLAQPVVLLRIDSEHASLRLFGVDFEAAPSFDSLNAAIAWAGSVSRRWVLQVTELDEPMLATGHAIDCVTLLTGADDAAVVAAYGAIKRLAETASGWTDELGAPVLRIATMGSDDATARAAYERLERAASVYLGRRIEFAANVERMGATGAVVLHECDIEGGVAPIIERILLNDTPDAPAAPAPAPVAPASPMPAPTRLVRHLTGLSPLEIDCPDAPPVELAADSDGAVHLLCRVTDDGLGAALAHLHSAGAWARRHATLLARACPEAHIDPAAPVVMHLLTPRPAACRDLLHSDLRCHILTRLGDAWLCEALN